MSYSPGSPGSTGGASRPLKTKDFAIAATGTIIAAVTGKCIKVCGVKLVLSLAGTVAFRDGGATALEGSMSLAANAGFVEDMDPPDYLLKTTAGNSLDLIVTGGGTAAGRITYWDTDAV
jgi:hypothetical protein